MSIKIVDNTIRLLGGGVPLRTANITAPSGSAPAAVNDSIVVRKNTPHVFSPLANDGGLIDPETFSITQNPVHGSLTVNQDGALLYTPLADFVGTDQAFYTVSNQYGTSAPARIAIVVQDETITVPEISRLMLYNATSDTYIRDLVAEDTFDLDSLGGDKISIVAELQTNGSDFSDMSFFVNGNVVETQAGAPFAIAGDGPGGDIFPWEPGVGTFLVEVVPYYSGGVGLSLSTNLSLTKNFAPVANDVDTTTANGVTKNIDLTGEVTDPDEDGIDWGTLEVVTQPSSGTVSVNGQGFDYVPDTTDDLQRFSYRVADTLGKYSLAATITIEIGTYNPPPQLSDWQVVVEQNGSIQINVATRATDADGINPDSLQIESLPAHGSVSNVSGGEFLYTPDPGYIGPDSIQVSIQDLNASPKRTRIATVNLTVGSQTLESRYDDWEPTVAGLWRYEIVRPEYRVDLSTLIAQHEGGTVVNVNNGMTVPEIEAAMAGASDTDVIVFAAGEYNINSPLNLTRGNIRIESIGPVIFNVNFSPGWAKFGFDIQGGGGTGLSSYVTAGLTDEHAYTLTLASAAGFSVGNWVRVVAYAKAGSYSSGNQIPVAGQSVHRMATMCKIVGIEGNVVEFDRKPAFFPGWLVLPEYAAVEQWNPIGNIAIVGDFTISYTDHLGVADSGDNGNDNGTWAAYAAGVAGFYARNVYNLAMFGVKTQDTPSASMWINHCVDVYMEECGSYGAHNRGSGGQGYACLHEGCTNIVARKWYDERMRHSWATSLNTSSVALDIEIDYTESNPEFSHGGFDRLQSFRVRVISPHQEGERYRIFDHREVKVLRRNVGWVGTFAGAKPFGEYDSSLRTLPGTDGTYDLRNTGSEHKPGFRDSANATYETYVGDAGFNLLYIIAMGHGNRIVLNSGTHYMRSNNPRGNVYFVAPILPSSPMAATIEDFRVNAERVSRPDLIIIPQGDGITGYDDLTISTVGSDTVITLPNSSSITILDIAADLINETHIKVMSISRMNRIHHRMGVQYMLKGSRPYIVDVRASGESMEIEYDRPVSLVATGTRVWYDPDGNVVQTIGSGNITKSGNVITHDLTGISEAKIRYDAGVFVADDDGQACNPEYDYHEDTVTAGPYRGTAFSAVLKQ